MDKKEILLVGIVAIIALILMLNAGHRTITGRFFGDFDIEEYYGQRAFVKPPAEELPRIPFLPFGPRKYLALPEKGDLVPSLVEFRVNGITVPETPYYNFIPVFQDRIRTYAGAFGPYDEDPSPYLGVFLCAYAYTIARAPMRCERVETAYDPGSGYVSFVRGYPPDEYIAYQAVGVNYAALFLVANDEYGVLAASNTARIKLIEK